MKTMTMMKSMMIGMMMCFGMSSMASTSTSQYIHSGRGSHPTVMTQCNCKQCQKARKQLDKHIRKHQGKQNRMACRECMKYSQMLNAHNNQHCNCCNCNGHNRSDHGGGNSHNRGRR